MFYVSCISMQAKRVQLNLSTRKKHYQTAAMVAFCHITKWWLNFHTAAAFLEMCTTFVVVVVLLENFSNVLDASSIKCNLLMRLKFSVCCCMCESHRVMRFADFLFSVVFSKLISVIVCTNEMDDTILYVAICAYWMINDAWEIGHENMLRMFWEKIRTIWKMKPNLSTRSEHFGSRIFVYFIDFNDSNWKWMELRNLF